MARRRPWGADARGRNTQWDVGGAAQGPRFASSDWQVHLGWSVGCSKGENCGAIGNELRRGIGRAARQTAGRGVVADRLE